MARDVGNADRTAASLFVRVRSAAHQRRANADASEEEGDDESSEEEQDDLADALAAEAAG
jgi:hypothetical protein